MSPREAPGAQTSSLSPRVGQATHPAKFRRPTHPGPYTPAEEMVIYRALAGGVLLLSLCGVPRDKILRAARRIAAQMPRDARPAPVLMSLDFDLPVDAVTEWYCHPDFLLKGRPRPLPKDGPHPSLKTLFARVSPSLDLAEGIAFLRSTRQLKRRGALYVPVSRVATHQGKPGPLWAHTLRTLAAKQVTVEHNLRRVREATRFDKSADCHSFPVRALGAFNRYLRARAVDFLCDLDAYMWRHANGRRATDKTVHLGVSTFQFQYTPEDLHLLPEQYLRTLRSLVTNLRRRRPNHRRRLGIPNDTPPGQASREGNHRSDKRRSRSADP